MIIRKRSVALWMWLLLVPLLFLPETIHSEQRNPVQKLDLARFKKMVAADGHFLLVFMAAWCAPCIKELPDLNALYAKYRASGLKMVGVSVDFDGPSAIQPIVDRLKVDFPIFWLGEEALEAYEISGIPLLIFIRNGAVAEKVVGLHSRAFFAEKIETFLTMP
ncbi:MAG: TlpA disulfide reductase family protein [Desulfobacterales bacterium]|nr:TlpA family protein disulfide reductase [Desulfobacterales bacterium]